MEGRSLKFGDQYKKYFTLYTRERRSTVTTTRHRTGAINLIESGYTAFTSNIIIIVGPNVFSLVAGGCLVRFLGTDTHRPHVY